jgi:hypothetical protein
MRPILWFDGARRRACDDRRMTFLGIVLMVQGFGALIADHFFGKNFGLLHLVFDGGALTVAAAVVGVLGLVVTVIGLAHDD